MWYRDYEEQNVGHLNLVTLLSFLYYHAMLSVAIKKTMVSYRYTFELDIRSISLNHHGIH